MRSILLLAIAACTGATAPAPAAPRRAPHAISEPRPGRIVVTDTSIEILELHFIGATTKVTPESFRFLDSIAATLDGNPSLALVEVRAFGSGAPPARRMELAELRARMVIEQLVRRGVERARL